MHASAAMRCASLICALLEIASLGNAPRAVMRVPIGISDAVLAAYAFPHFSRQMRVSLRLLQRCPPRCAASWQVVAHDGEPVGILGADLVARLLNGRVVSFAQ